MLKHVHIHTNGKIHSSWVNDREKCTSLIWLNVKIDVHNTATTTINATTKLNKSDSNNHNAIEDRHTVNEEPKVWIKPNAF